MSAYVQPRIYTPDEYRQKPRDFNPLLAEKIILRIANGESLQDVCEELDMPLPATFLSWIEQDEDLRKSYATAQRYRTALLVDRMINISVSSDPNRARLAFDINKFHAEKIIPEVYGSTADRRITEDKRAQPDQRAELRRRIEDMVGRRRVGV